MLIDCMRCVYPQAKRNNITYILSQRLANTFVVVPPQAQGSLPYLRC